MPWRCFCLCFQRASPTVSFHILTGRKPGPFPGHSRRDRMIPKLRPNPFSHASIRYLDGEPVELRIWSVTRSRGALTRNFARDGRADFDRICDIVMRGGTDGRADGSLSIGDFVVLAKLGLWAAEPDLIDPIVIEAPIRSDAAS